MIIKITKKIFFACTMLVCSYVNSQTYCDSNPVDIHGNLSVSGNRIVDQNNAAVSFAGNSFFWSNTGFNAEKFYNADVVSWLKDDWGSTIVRAAMGVDELGGYITDPDANQERVETIVDAAIAEGLYVIIDWHSHHAESYESQAIDFFKKMAKKYGDYPNVIYEVYNEPINSSWSNAIKPYAEAVISEIRAIDSDNLIIVGSSTYSQDVDIASNDPITSSTNIAYTLHFYAGTHFASLRAKAQTALDNGVALMVTEWGTVNASGDGGVNESSTDEWMDFLAENDITHLNWSVNDKREGASIVNPGVSEFGNWSDSDLTESGAKVKSIIEDWAQYCDGEPITDDNEKVEEEEEVEENETTSCNNIGTWSSSSVYEDAGTQVFYNGTIYENKWYTQGDNPEEFSEFSWSLWTVIGTCESRAAKSLNSVVGITAFPNPFTNAISVSNDTTDQLIDSLQLIDLSGKIIAIENGSSINNLEGIGNGMYLLQGLNTEGQVIAIEKIIKE